jgi:hypothetical protein
MIIAERLETALPITETLTKFGLETGAPLDAAIFDPRSGVTNPWLADWSAGTWGNSKYMETLVEGDTGRYSATANVSGAEAASTYLEVYIGVTAGGTGGSQKEIALVNNLVDSARQTTGGPGPWTTASGDPVIANPIIEAINAQTVLLLESCAPADSCPTPILPVIYTGHKGDNLLVPVYRNNTLIPDSELANGSQFAMSVNNITDGTTLDITQYVEWAGTGHLAYTSRAGDGVFESAGKWEYQATGLTEQGQPFVSVRLTARVYDEIV